MDERNIAILLRLSPRQHTKLMKTAKDMQRLTGETLEYCVEELLSSMLRARMHRG